MKPPCYQSEIVQYISGVMSGKITAGRLQRLAVKRHLADLKTAKKRGWSFKRGRLPGPSGSSSQSSFIRKNSVGAKAGSPLILSPAQKKFIVWSLFGWRDQDGYRRFRKLTSKWLESSASRPSARRFCCWFSASTCLPTSLANSTRSRQTKKQAKIVWREAESNGQEVASAAKTRQCPGEFAGSEERRQLYPASLLDGGQLDGLNPSVIVKDEIHAWQDRHRESHEKLERADGGRLQPLNLGITTAGSDRSSIWKEERDWARRVVESVLTGEIVDDRLFSFICCIDTEAHECRSALARAATAASLAMCLQTIHSSDPAGRKRTRTSESALGFDKYHEHSNRAKKDAAYLRVFMRYTAT